MMSHDIRTRRDTKDAPAGRSAAGKRVGYLLGRWKRASAATGGIGKPACSESKAAAARQGDRSKIAGEAELQRSGEGGRGGAGSRHNGFEYRGNRHRPEDPGGFIPVKGRVACLCFSAMCLSAVLLLPLPAAQAAGEEPEGAGAAAEATVGAEAPVLEDETKPAGNQVFELGEIVVTEQRAISGEVATQTEVTREDFLLRGVNNAADALRYIPGGTVSFSRGSLSGNGKDEELIRLRGYETTDVLILLDGMPMTEPYMKRVDLSQILLDNVSKIKVVKGPSSVLYGANTAGGIVNIVSEKGEGFRSFLDQRFGDYKSFRTLAQNQGAKGPVDYVIGGSYDRSDGYAISRDFPGALNQPGTLRVNSDYERYNVAGRVGSELGKNGSASVGGGYYSFRGGVPFSMSDFDPTLWRKDWDRWYVNAFTDWDILDNLGVKGQFFYDRFENRIQTYTDTTFQQIGSDGKAVSTHDNDTYGYYLNPWWNLGTWSLLRAGIRYEKDSVETQDELYDPWDRYQAEVFSFSLEDEVRPWKPLGLVAGVGYNLFRKVEASSGGVVEDPGNDIDSVDFQVGVLYDLLPEIQLHASVARKTSFPTLRQLYDPDGGYEFLQTQTGLNYEVGVDGAYGEQYVGGALALFRSDVDNLIVKKEFGNTFQYRNVGQALLQGLELSSFWHPWEWLGLFVNYTFLYSENKDTGRELDFRPPNVVNAEVLYQSSFVLNAGAIFSYTSSQTYEPKAQPGGRERLPARGLWEVHISQKFPFRKVSKRYAELYVDVENLLDEYYEEDPRKAAPGRMVWVGVRGAF
jgi:outer membrane cobalamin receptor